MLTLLWSSRRVRLLVCDAAAAMKFLSLTNRLLQATLPVPSPALRSSSSSPMWRKPAQFQSSCTTTPERPPVSTSTAN